MFKTIAKQCKATIILLLLFTLFLGFIYTGAITGFASILFPNKSNGSLIRQNNTVIGSKLIGQSFTSLKYFWGRPSVSSTLPYVAVTARGSNLGPTNPLLRKNIEDRIAIFKKSDLQNNNLIPIELVTASASGIDPHISPAAAFYQVNRVAKARNLHPDIVNQIVKDHIKKRQFGIFGEPRINVLELNLDLDARQAAPHKH